MAVSSEWALLLAVLKAVITLILVATPGFIAGYVGIANREFLQRLSRFQVTFFMPSLAFSTFGSRFELNQFGKLWPLMFWSCAQLAAGWYSSWLILQTQAANRWQQSSQAFSVLLQLAVAFQNIGAFNFPLLMALCNTEGLFQQASDQCFAEGVLMIFGYHIPWDFTLWTRGYAAMMALQTPPIEVAKGAADALKISVGCADGQSKPTNCSKLEQKALHAAGHVLNPMLCAMMLGVTVGIVPTLHGALFEKGAILSPLGDATKQLGAPGPLIGMLILGGTLGIAVRQFKDMPKSTSSLRHPGLRSWIVASIAGKLFLLPAIGFCVFSALCMLQRRATADAALYPHLPVPRHSGSPEAEGMGILAIFAQAIWPANKLLRAIVVMQWSAPSCLTLTVLCHRVGLDDGVVQAVALLYLAMYAVTMLTTTLWVSCGLTFF